MYTLHKKCIKMGTTDFPYTPFFSFFFIAYLFSPFPSHPLPPNFPFFSTLLSTFVLLLLHVFFLSFSFFLYTTYTFLFSTLAINHYFSIYWFSFSYHKLFVLFIFFCTVPPSNAIYNINLLYKTQLQYICIYILYKII